MVVYNKEEAKFLLWKIESLLETWLFFENDEVNLELESPNCSNYYCDFKQGRDASEDQTEVALKK